MHLLGLNMMAKKRWFSFPMNDIVSIYTELDDSIVSFAYIMFNFIVATLLVYYYMLIIIINATRKV